MKTVTLFIPCLVDGLYPEVAEAMVRLFRSLSIDMRYPRAQTCCGQPAFNAGYRKEAAAAARHFIRTFSDAEQVVCPSGSCVHMVRHHYPLLFENDPAWRRRALQVAGKTFELTEYLVNILKIRKIDAAYPGRVTYHDSCHLMRGLGIADQPRRLIKMVEGVKFVEMADPDLCCGFGGSFSVKYPEISTAMLEEKVRNIQASGADTLVGCDMGCLMNIQGMLHRKNLPVRTLHIAQLLVT